MTAVLSEMVGSMKTEPSFSHQPLMRSMFLCKWPDLRSWDGALGMKWLGAMGCQIVRALGLILSSYLLTIGSRVARGTARRHCSCVAGSGEMQFTSCATAWVWVLSMLPVVPARVVEAPDSIMAR